jgi:hypothetical protein
MIRVIMISAGDPNATLTLVKQQYPDWNWSN